jgi:hydroxyacylglutathione hydrolase
MKINRLIFNPIQVNTYILTDKNGDCAVIDCGCYNEEESGMLVRFLEKEKLKPVLLLNTHCHLDHIFGNKFMLEKYKLLTKASADEEENRLDAVEHALLFGLTMDPPPSVSEFITGDQEIVFANTKLKTLSVPGHSPGSIAFYSEEDEVVFTGDALFNGSIGRTDLTGGNSDALLKSIKTKLFTLPDNTRVLPGHGSETTIGKEKSTNPFFKISL